MLKNLNDYLSLFALAIIALLSIRFFIGSLIPNQTEGDTHSNRKAYLKDYINNEED